MSNNKTYKWNKSISLQLQYAMNILDWCETNYGDKPREDRKLPSVQSDNEEERTLALRLIKIKRQLSKKNLDVDLEKIDNEEYKKIIEIIRTLEKEYGIDAHLRNILKVKKWCETNYGDKPKEERRLPLLKSDDEEEREMANYLLAVRSHIIRKYKGLDVNKIKDEDNKEIIQIVNELDSNYKNTKKIKQDNDEIVISKKHSLKEYASKVLQDVREWCDKRYGDKPREEKFLPGMEERYLLKIGEEPIVYSDEEKKKEARLHGKLLKLKKALKRYDLVPLEQIKNKEHREIVKQLRELDKEYGIGIDLRNLLNVKKWCETQYGDKSREYRRLPYIESKNKEERDVASKLSKIRYSIGKVYEGIPLNEIVDEEHREIVEIIRELDKEYGLSGDLKSLIMIKKWCEETFKDKPLEEAHLPYCKSEDQYERKLGTKLETVKGRNNILNQMIRSKKLTLDEIQNPDTKETVELLIQLEDKYGNSSMLKKILEIKEWCEKNYGDKPRDERKLPTLRSKDEKEKYFALLLNTMRTKSLRQYDGIEIDKIENENLRRILEVIKYLEENYESSRQRNMRIAKRIRGQDLGNATYDANTKICREVENELNKLKGNNERDSK